LAKTHAEQLYESVQNQPRKLTARERRRVLVYLDEIGDLSQKSNYELARLFQVTEKVIRDDRKKLLATIAADLTADNAISLVAKHAADLHSLIRLAYKGLNAVDPGSIYHRNYLETLAKLEGQYFSTLQEIGIVRKELGHMAVTHEEWEATISEDAIAGVQPVAPKTNDNA